VQPASRLRYWHEDVSGGITTVVEQRVAGQAVRTLLTNGKFQGNDSGETAAQIAFALLPCLVTPGRDRALVIGLGTGHSAEVVAAAGFAAIEIAEVSPGIVGAARQHFGTLNRAVLDDPRVRLFVEDGRNHLLRSRAHYDVITMELSGVWFAGAANLYSRQFYQLAADHLAPGGVLQQWIQLHHIAFEEVSSTLQAMRAVFPFVSVWLIGRQGILLGSARSVAPSPAALAALGASPGLDRDRAQLERSTGLTLARIEERLLLDADEVTALARAGEARGIPTTTDENRYVEYACPRHNLEVGRTVASTALELLDFALPAHRRARARQLGLGQ
jgi:spermidine synthase